MSIDADQRDEAWTAGRKSMAASILQCCYHELDPNDKEKSVLLAERNQAVVILREVCGEYGDNDWPDELYLPDVIEKHLFRNLNDNRDTDHCANDGSNRE